MKLRILLILVLMLTIVVAVPVVRAHGGGTPQLTNEDIGPYWISVWTSPEPPREGQLHVTVAVSEPGEEQGQQSGAPVLGATVNVTMIPRSGGLADISTRASNEQSSNKLFYEADLVVPAAGDWQVEVDVQGAEGSGQAQFNLAVQPTRDDGWLLMGGAGFLVVAAFLFYFAARRRRHG